MTLSPFFKIFWLRPRRSLLSIGILLWSLAGRARGTEKLAHRKKDDDHIPRDTMAIYSHKPAELTDKLQISPAARQTR